MSMNHYKFPEHLEPFRSSIELYGYSSVEAAMARDQIIMMSIEHLKVVAQLNLLERFVKNKWLTIPL